MPQKLALASLCAYMKVIHNLNLKIFIENVQRIPHLLTIAQSECQK